MTVELDRAVAPAVNRRPLTAKAQSQSQVSPRGICGGQNDTSTGFSPSTSVFPCQNHSTSAPYSFIYHHHVGLTLETDRR
jgi:hypothetical protein